MTNPLKGQIQIELAGDTYTCRLTVDALISIESVLDKGILEFTSQLSQANVRVGEIAVILLHALRGGGNDFDEKKVKSLIQQSGIVASCTQVATLLVDTLNDPNSEDDEDAKKA